MHTFKVTAADLVWREKVIVGGLRQEAVVLLILFAGLVAGMLPGG
jgi:hypothetical protein